MTPRPRPGKPTLLVAFTLKLVLQLFVLLLLPFVGLVVGLLDGVLAVALTTQGRVLS